MKDQVTFFVDGQRIRFTPDGRVAVLDAIKALCDIADCRKVWPDMLSNWPQLSKVCSTYRFEPQEETAVTTPLGWEEIETHLLDYIAP